MIRSDLICYKNYYGSVHFDPQEELFFGKIEFIRDLVNYEASEAKSLVKAFHEAVDSYLETFFCERYTFTPSLAKNVCLRIFCQKNEVFRKKGKYFPILLLH